MASLMEQFAVSFTVVTPFFLVMGLGWAMRRIRLVDANVIAGLNKLVYFCFLPITIFLNIYRANLGYAFDLGLVSFFVTGTVTFFLLLWLIGARFLKRTQIAAFVQAGYRSNYVILATAILALLMGEEALPKTTVMIPFLVITYAGLAAIIFIVSGKKAEGEKSSHTVGAVLLGLVKSPLIIGASLGITANLSGLPIPMFIEFSLGYVTNMATPAALFGIGGVLSLEKVRQNLKLAVITTLVKNVAMPICLIIPAILFGFRGIELAIIAMIALTPTALVSYATAVSMDGDGDLTASCLVLSTATALFTIVPALAVLRAMGFF